MGVVFLMTPAHKQPPAAGVLRSAASLESLDDKGQPNCRLLAARSFTLPSHCRHTPVNAELTAAESGIRALDRVLREVGVIYIYRAFIPASMWDVLVGLYRIREL